VIGSSSSSSTTLIVLYKPSLNIQLENTQEVQHVISWNQPFGPKLVAINRIQATAPLTGQGFGVFFLRGHISLKNRS
jgi:hypothetical protein